jgi:hypothetical protein
MANDRFAPRVRRLGKIALDRKRTLSQTQLTISCNGDMRTKLAMKQVLLNQPLPAADVDRLAGREVARE